MSQSNSDPVYGSMGICLGTVIGALVKEPEVTGRDRQGKDIVRTVLISVRPRKSTSSKREKQINEIVITASGSVADNLTRNYEYGRKAFITGEMRVDADATEIHVAQLSWIDPGSQGP